MEFFLKERKLEIGILHNKWARQAISFEFKNPAQAKGEYRNFWTSVKWFAEGENSKQYFLQHVLHRRILNGNSKQKSS